MVTKTVQENILFYLLGSWFTTSHVQRCLYAAVAPASVYHMWSLCCLQTMPLHYSVPMPPEVRSDHATEKYILVGIIDHMPLFRDCTLGFAFLWRPIVFLPLLSWFNTLPLFTENPKYIILPPFFLLS